MANVLTGIRILCGMLFFLFPTSPFLSAFLYLLGGLTDAVDGTVARKTGKASAFGAKFDTVADLIFALFILLKVFLTLEIPALFWVWIGVILLLKMIAVVIGIWRWHQLVSVHSLLNKICGGLIYSALPILTLPVSLTVKGIVFTVCGTVATSAALYECFFAWKNCNLTENTV